MHNQQRSNRYPRQVPLPEEFSFKPEDWPRWIKRFERFRKPTGLYQKDGENQVNTLIYAMGEEADGIVISFGLTNPGEGTSV